MAYLVVANQISYNKHLTIYSFALHLVGVLGMLPTVDGSENFRQKRASFFGW